MSDAELATLLRPHVQRIADALAARAEGEHPYADTGVRSFAAGADVFTPDDAPRFAYNLTPGRFEAIVLVLDGATPVGGAADLREALRRRCDRLVVVRADERL